MNGLKKWVIRCGCDDQEAYLYQIYLANGQKVYKYGPDPGMAMQFEHRDEAEKIAEKRQATVCRLRMLRDGKLKVEAGK